jgi:hypothetical protein
MPEIFTSKKFIVLLVGIVAVMVARKLGLGTDIEAMITGMVGTYQLGQGLTDHGKEAAKINASAAAAATESPVLGALGPRGFASVEVLVLIAMFVAGVACVASCAWLKGQAHDVKAAIVDCTKGERAKLVDEFKPTVQAILDAAVSRARDEQPTTTEGLHPVARSERVPCGMLSGCTQFSGELALAEPLGIDWHKVADETKDKLRSLGKETGACVAAEVFAGWIGAKRTFARYEVMPEAARDGFNVLRAELWPGATYHTQAGDL